MGRGGVGSDSEEEEEEEELDLSNSDVVTKYKTAADISNRALALLVQGCKDGASILELGKQNDAFLEEQLGNIFNKGPKNKKIEKGMAFPTCLSVNNVVGHYCPMDESADKKLAKGDLVKIDFGCHVDGFIANVAHTVCVGDAPDAPITGRAADAVACADKCFEAAIRLIKPGNTTLMVHETLEKIATVYGCNLVEGVLTHQMKRFVIDGNKVVLNKPSPEQRVEEQKFEENEVYSIDIVVSTGEGKPKLLDEKQTTVYKRALEANYKLKMKASRAVFSDINKRFPTMPFTMRSLEPPEGKPASIRLGLAECLGHELLHAYPVLHEKPEELVAQVKSTVLLMPNGSDRITLHPVQLCETEKAITDEEVLALLATSVRSKKSKNKKKKKAAAEGATEE